MLAPAYDYRVEFGTKKEKIRPLSLPLNEGVIALDPGHGGIDAGAISSRGTREKRST